MDSKFLVAALAKNRAQPFSSYNNTIDIQSVWPRLPSFGVFTPGHI